jgi:GNAT superfamily N-acetyltransferase
VTIEDATPADASEILRLRSQAERWLASRGIDQWREGEVTPADVAAQIGRGEWHVVREGAALCAAGRLLWSDPDVWRERDRLAAYVHGLVVDRRLAGRGLGSTFLAWAEDRARAAGVPALRLDCVETNGDLRRYYRDRGFREVGRRDFGGERWLPVVLMQKPLSS